MVFIKKSTFFGSCHYLKIIFKKIDSDIGHSFQISKSCKKGIQNQNNIQQEYRKINEAIMNSL